MGLLQFCHSVAVAVVYRGPSRPPFARSLLLLASIIVETGLTDGRQTAPPRPDQIREIGRFIIAVDTPWPICVRAGIVCVCLSGDVSE